MNVTTSPSNDVGGLLEGQPITKVKYELDPLTIAVLCSGGLVILIVLACGLFKCWRSYLCRYGEDGGKRVVPVTVQEEEDLDFCVSRTVTESLPKYWSNAAAEDALAFDHLMYVSKELHPMFDALLAQTYEAKATQDRPCPSGTCERMGGGCPCVQPGGTPGLPAGFRVRRVVRVEDSTKWERYVQKRQSIAEARAGDRLMGLRPRAQTDKFAAHFPEAFEPVERTLNEAYLLHGTEVRRALAIALQDFKIDLAGSRTGTALFGSGCYLAESSTKADEYARDEPGGYYENTFALLLCRVCLGKYYYTEHDATAELQVASGAFDSVLGDRCRVSGTFREFVVYDADQVYPEYVVFYSRVPADVPPGQHEAFLASVPFHMELPIYWRHCHRNPETEPFQAQYVVRRRTRDLLQKLATASLGRSDQRVDVLSARRVEHADVWNRYVYFKQRLRLELFERTGGTFFGFPRAEELDGNPASGHVITAAVLKGMGLEDTISIENVEEEVNEHLLWHGTSKHAAEAIVQTDFCIPDGSPKAIRHGRRFGNGAYFAEALWKALEYARVEDDGVQFVLLCRVLCGNMYYTEGNAELSADVSARVSGKHCVLANPGQVGPREFIVHNEAQVYPEYILELRWHK